MRQEINTPLTAQGGKTKQVLNGLQGIVLAKAIQEEGRLRRVSSGNEWMHFLGQNRNPCGINKDRLIYSYVRDSSPGQHHSIQPNPVLRLLPTNTKEMISHSVPSCHLNIGKPTHILIHMTIPWIHGRQLHRRLFHLAIPSLGLRFFTL